MIPELVSIPSRDDLLDLLKRELGPGRVANLTRPVNMDQASERANVFRLAYNRTVKEIDSMWDQSLLAPIRAEYPSSFLPNGQLLCELPTNTGALKNFLLAHWPTSQSTHHRPQPVWLLDNVASQTERVFGDNGIRPHLGWDAGDYCPFALDVALTGTRPVEMIFTPDQLAKLDMLVMIMLKNPVQSSGVILTAGGVATRELSKVVEQSHLVSSPVKLVVPYEVKFEVDGIVVQETRRMTISPFNLRSTKMSSDEGALVFSVSAGCKIATFGGDFEERVYNDIVYELASALTNTTRSSSSYFTQLRPIKPPTSPGTFGRAFAIAVGSAALHERRHNLHLTPELLDPLLGHEFQQKYSAELATIQPLTGPYSHSEWSSPRTPAQLVHALVQQHASSRRVYFASLRDRVAKGEKVDECERKELAEADAGAERARQMRAGWTEAQKKSAAKYHHDLHLVRAAENIAQHGSATHPTKLENQRIQQNANRATDSGKTKFNEALAKSKAKDPRTLNLQSRLNQNRKYLGLAEVEFGGKTVQTKQQTLDELGQAMARAGWNEEVDSVQVRRALGDLGMARRLVTMGHRSTVEKEALVLEYEADQEKDEAERKKVRVQKLSHFNYLIKKANLSVPAGYGAPQSNRYQLKRWQLYRDHLVARNESIDPFVQGRIREYQLLVNFKEHQQ